MTRLHHLFIIAKLFAEFVLVDDLMIACGKKARHAIRWWWWWAGEGGLQTTARARECSVRADESRAG